MATSRKRPYWLGGGSESCGVCRQSYILEMECRCVACDRGVCVLCAVTVWETGETFCDECRSEVNG